MVKRRRPPQWHLWCTAGGLFAAVAVGVYVGEIPVPDADDVTRLTNLRPDPSVHADPASFAGSVSDGVDSVLADLGIPANALRRRGQDSVIDTFDVRVPHDLPVASVNRHLTEYVRWHGGTVVQGIERQGPAAVDLTVGIDSTTTTLFRLRHDRGLQRRHGRIALVIDLQDAPAARQRRLADVDQPLTLIGAARAADKPGQRQLLSSTPETVPVFDDDAITQSDVERRLWALAERAADDGQAVAQAALRPATLAALETMLPQLERRGYRFVTLAELER